VEGEGRKLYEKIEGEFETVVGFPVSLFRGFISQL
jgi:predicted house-cleaning NTP pyrophosphatase (Maf/HAM1 superfamily)